MLIDKLVLIDFESKGYWKEKDIKDLEKEYFDSDFFFVELIRLLMKEEGRKNYYFLIFLI